MTPPISDAAFPVGAAILQNPLTNKGSAFTLGERERLGLQGLLPAACNTIQQQEERIYARISKLDNPLDVYVELAALQDRNETLFYLPAKGTSGRIYASGLHTNSGAGNAEIQFHFSSSSRRVDHARSPWPYKYSAGKCSARARHKIDGGYR